LILILFNGYTPQTNKQTNEQTNKQTNKRHKENRKILKEFIYNNVFLFDVDER
jgi:hypothetical protein